MKNLTKFALTSAILIILAGCGGGGDNPKEVPTKPEVSGIPTKDFDVIACSDPSDSGCLEAKAFDLKKQNVAVLNPPKDIGVGEYLYFNGKRFGVVPKEEKRLTPLNFLAYGLFKYAQEVGSNWCGPCRLVAPASYIDAKKQLKELFNLTGTKEQNEALLWLINRNLEAMGESGVSLKEAYFADIKAMAESLVNLTKKGEAPDLSHLHLVKDSKGRVLGVSSTPPNDCPEYLGECLDSWGVLDKNRAIKLGYDIRQKSGTQSASQQAFESLTCEANEEKQIFMYGVEDNFDLSNSEPVHPQGIALSNYNGFPSQSTYDNNTSLPIPGYGNLNSNIMYFEETLSNLPTNMTKGYLAIGLKTLERASSSNSMLHFGYAGLPYWYRASLPDLTIDGWTHISNSNTYYKDIGQIILDQNINLLQYIQGGNNYLDVICLGALDIDYIAVAACVPKPKPDGIPIKEVPVKLECNADKGEQFTEVWGGNGDDFAMPIDVTNPPAGFANAVKYDENITKLGTFADRITLPNQTITKMVVTVNTRAGANGYQNDVLLLGDVNSSSGIVHDPNDPSAIATLNGGKAHQIYATNPSGTLLSLVNSNHYLDAIAYDQTEVDSIRVSMCVVDKKDGDLNITKKPGRKFTKNGVNYSYFSINVGGTLPSGETLVINENVPNGATLESYYSIPYNTQPSWVCTPNPVVYGAATVTCLISATNGDITNIPTLNVLMSSKFEKLQNCVEINKESQGTYYNSNPRNDSDCATVGFEPPKEGDLAITKKVIKSYTDSKGVNHAVYGISVSGTLPANSPLTIDEVVANGAVLTNINALAPWSCSPNTPVNGPATVTCTIPAQNSALNPIPDIFIEMETESEKLENCANINEKFSPVAYNNNPKNDRACDTATFGKPDDSKICSEQIVANLDNPNLWSDSSGNHPTVNNPIPNIWDNSYTWFNFPQTPYAYYTLKSKKFCACGSRGGVKLQGMRIDNVGNLVLNSLSTSTATLIAAQNTATTHNFLAAYPPATGSAVIPYNVIGKNYQLEFNIHNHKLWSGGALKGQLRFTGHWGECTKEDVIKETPMEPKDEKPVVYSDVNSSGSFDENTTIAVIESEENNPNIGNIGNQRKIAILVGEDLQEITKTPEQLFGNKLPNSYSIVVGCVEDYVNVVIKAAATKVYKTDVKCSGSWVKYYP